MAKTKISQFDANAANNTDLNSISIAEGTAPSNINNAIRELMSQLADLNLGNEVLSTLKIDNLHLDGNTIVTLDTNGDLNLTPNGTGAVTIAKVDINGGAIDGTPIGGSSASTGAFTTLSASSTANLGSTVTISGGNIDGVIGANTPAAITGTVITANTNFAGNITGNVTGNVTGNLTGNVTGNVTGDVTGDVTGNITASSGSSTFNNVTINGTLDMDSTTSQTITGLATPSGSTDAATKGYVDTEVSALVDSAPSTLNTLNELAAALGDDASFSTTVTNSIAAKLPLAGGTMTGDINLDSNSLTNLAAPSNNNDAARKAYVDTADALKLNLSGGTLSGDLAMGDNKITGLAAPTADGDAARKKYVDDIAGSGTAAATSASQAATSATNAANSATASANSATAAATSATSSATNLTNFEKQYLGSKASAPTADNDGNTLDATYEGTLYFNSTTDDLYVWNGSAWEQAAFTASGFLSNLSEDTTPQLGGDLDVNGQNIVSTSNADIDILPNGSGKINLDGNGSSGGVTVSDGLIDIRTGTGAVSKINFYCESSNAHAQTIQAQPHSAGVTNALTLPAGGNQEIVGTTATQTLTNKTIDASQLSGSVANARLDTELQALAGLTSAADKGIQFTGSGTAATYDLTTAGKALLDDADAAAQRTTLGLGSAATLTAGTSANNAVQLDSNAKLPAVDGSQLTGISGGTDQIDMVVGTGSDAISVGNVVTRESNGETKKVKQTTATTNYTLTARDVQSSISGYSNANYTKSVGCLGMEGRYLHAWWNGNNVILTGYSHSGSGTWTKGSDVNTNRDHDNNSYARMKISYVPTLNTSAGGTFLLQIHDGQSSVCGNYCGRAGYLRILAVTVDSSGAVTNHGPLFDIGAKLGENSNHASSIVYGDHVVISAGNETCELVGAYISVWEFYGIASTNGIGSITITHNGSSYASSGHGKQSLGFSDSYYSYTSMMMEYDHTNEVIVCGQVQGSQTSFRSFKKSSGTYNWNNQSSWTDSNLGLSTSYRSDTNRLGSASGEGYVFFGRADSSNLNYRGFQISSGGGLSGSFNILSGSGFNNPRVADIKYSFINNKIYLAEEGASSTYGNNGYVRSYSVSGTTVTGEDTVNASQSPTNVFGQSFSIPFDKFSTGFTDVNQVRYFGIYATNTGSGNNGMMYKSGVYDGSVTATTTNKLLAFGFAQKAGSAGDTISVLPFDSESIEQNQTSLTHDSDYYVTDTGTLGTSAGTDNVFVGKAINSTFLRLPSKDISVASGGDSRIFCGSYDFRVDGSSTAQNVLISLPSDYTAANVRAYEINYYGIGFAADGNHFTFKPYNGTSSVLSGNTVYLSIFSAYDSSDRVQTSKAVSAGFPLQRGDGTARDAYSGNDVDNPKQNYDNTSGHGGQLNGRAIYTNSLRNGSYDYSSTWRWGSSATNHAFARGIGSLGNGSSTSNYADGFYFYIGDDSQSAQSTAIMEGVVSVYAIIG